MDYRDYTSYEQADFSELEGKTIKFIEGLNAGSEQMKIVCEDGSLFKLTYYDDCCASCSIEDIVGNVDDLIGSTILLAECVESNSPEGEELEERKAEYEAAKAEYEANGNKTTDFYYCGPKPENDFQEESETWAFYKLSTIKGSVTIRWYGSSNGYYSETATFEKFKENKK